MCQKHEVKRKQKFESRETKKFSLKPPNSAEQTNEIRAYIFWEILISIKRSLSAWSQSQGAAWRGAGWRWRFNKTTKTKKSPIRGDAHRPTEAPCRFSILHMPLCAVCVFARRCWCAAQGERFVQLTAAAPFLLTSSQPCFKTLYVRAFRNHRWGWVAALGAQNKTPSPPPAPTRFSQRLNHAASATKASLDFAIQILWCRLQDLRLLLFHCRRSHSSQSTSRETSFCDTKLCAAKELKAAKRPSACLLKWVCNRRATDVQRVARSPKCTGASTAVIYFLCKTSTLTNVIRRAKRFFVMLEPHSVPEVIQIE